MYVPLWQPNELFLWRCLQVLLAVQGLQNQNHKKKFFGKKQKFLTEKVFYGEIEAVRVRSSLSDWKGMDWPKMARTSSSFLALPVTKVTDRETTTPDAAFAATAAIFQNAIFFLAPF